MATPRSELLVKIQSVYKWYPVRRAGVFSPIIGNLKAIDGLSFYIEKGETLGLVGESGCGKTTLAKLILRLENPTSGSINFDGYNLLKLSQRELRQQRRNMQIIFQDPYDSLDPRMTAWDIIEEPLAIHGEPRLSRQKRVSELIDFVGLSSFHARRYPHEFSGGQRQRIGIARALALNPKFIVCDEPVSALDVSIQSQILNLLSDLKRKFSLTYFKRNSTRRKSKFF